jgi:TRAP-type C4-dicarboxylate transport system substrate-binding protein
VGAHPAVRSARRAWPLLLAAKQRWDALTPAQQERYRRMASEYARRGRESLGRRPRRGR